ncbi:TIR domain-containing protein [Amycolatopsis cynarae]|uniref:TIR domain-containing protein n=1 Tax=Amycolatopsis cynarae TaxID=2995223 RepID=A0ABY7AY01_9PSEU|nr:TIR domain-containing protein [Amycolatopsis sp. HUAS 11-8]WAL63898.1 TIR domain-containing protein [Amycolatopsis sp. HUAS 11-8]
MATRQVIPPDSLLWHVHPPAESAALPLSPHEETALLEALLPDPRLFTSAGLRVLTPARLEGRVLSAVRTTSELLVAHLEPGEDRAAVTPDDVPGVQGLRWTSDLDFPRETLLLFRDRCPADVLRPVPRLSARLDDADGVHRLTELLAPYRVRVAEAERAGLPLVFLNYRTAGGTLEVFLLDEELRRRLGDDAVFRDHRSLRAGEDFAEVLLRNARGVKVMLSVIGARWDASYDERGGRLLDQGGDWVRREIAEALAHGVCVVPVILGVRSRLDPDELPADIRKLAGLQTLQLVERADRQDVARLVDKLFDEVPVLAKAYAERRAVRGESP